MAACVTRMYGNPLHNVVSRVISIRRRKTDGLLTKWSASWTAIPVMGSIQISP